jgi:3',5'-cyclic AMP phosphodiesterase CpdA
MVKLRTEILQQPQKEQVRLSVRTDEPGKTFQVKLHQKLEPEKSTYSKIKKMLVISDIEGEFGALRSLLQGNGVIDENYRWTFGDGHLVLLGDFVDRGEMVTEVLWLIYSLEIQALVSGGKVHYILGNHEVMNMQGDDRYVHFRYKVQADTMQIAYMELFSRQSELGRWMATKNVIERIGNILFAHAGISGFFNQVGMTLNAVNDSARLYYSDTSAIYISPHADFLFGDYGPLWYRGYYIGTKRATVSQVDSTLDIYSIRHIVTGHSLIGHEILSAYDGKVINIDVPHHAGNSEALLIEGNKMHRVNAKAEKMKIAARP